MTIAVFFFKQKTAYEMRISDWSSDVCSSDLGPRAFYEGALADSIAADLRSGGSRITTDDLAAYAVEEPEPLTGRHRGAELHTAGAVSGGQRLLDMLAYVERNLAPRNAVGADTWIEIGSAHV